MNFQVLQGGDKEQARIDYDVQHHGVRKLRAAPGTWVQARSGNGHIHSVGAYDFIRNYGPYRDRREQTDQTISHAVVLFRCGGQAFDEKLMEMRDPIDQGPRMCKKCILKLLTP